MLFKKKKKKERKRKEMQNASNELKIFFLDKMEEDFLRQTFNI